MTRRMVGCVGPALLVLVAAPALRAAAPRTVPSLEQVVRDWTDYQKTVSQRVVGLDSVGVSEHYHRPALAGRYIINLTTDGRRYQLAMRLLGPASSVDAPDLKDDAPPTWTTELTWDGKRRVSYMMPRPPMPPDVTLSVLGEDPPDVGQAIGRTAEGPFVGYFDDPDPIDAVLKEATRHAVRFDADRVCWVVDATGPGGHYTVWFRDGPVRQISRVEIHKGEHDDYFGHPVGKEPPPPPAMPRGFDPPPREPRIVAIDYTWQADEAQQFGDVFLVTHGEATTIWTCEDGTKLTTRETTNRRWVGRPDLTNAALFAPHVPNGTAVTLLEVETGLHYVWVNGEYEPVGAADMPRLAENNVAGAKALASGQGSGDLGPASPRRDQTAQALGHASPPIWLLASGAGLAILLVLLGLLLSRGRASGGQPKVER